MDKPVLTDKDQFPTEEIIFSNIGRTKTVWKSVFQYIHTNHPDFLEQWRYYNDGKSWLMKLTRKSKTIFWLGVLNGVFRITFYFSEKAVVEIMKGKLSAKLWKKFNEANKVGKSTSITLLMDDKQNVELVKELILVKLQVK
jgi:hypothetical protein